MNQKWNIRNSIWNVSLAIPLVILAAGSAAQAQQRPQHPPMDAKTQAAFEACAQASNLPARGSGERPTQEQREKMDACLTEKGVSLPRHFGRHGGRPEDGERPSQPPPQQQRNTSADDSSPGAQ